MEKGNINWTDARIGDSALVTSENKMGVILKDYGRKFHLRFADGSEKTYDASELNFFNTDDDYERGGSIKKGDVYQWNTVEYNSKKGNNYKVVKNIEITDIDSKGQVIGRVVGTSNQFIIRDPQKNLKSKVSKMETGGDIERGGAHMYIELKDSDIVVYHGDAFKIYKNAKPIFVISGAKKGSWDELWQSIRSIQSSNTDGQKGSAHIYVKLSNGDITVYHGDNVRQFRKLDEDERLFLQKNVRKDSWDRVYNTLMNLKSVKMENGGMAGKTYFQPVIRKDKNNPNFLYIDIYYPEGKGILSIGQSKTMFGREREEGALKALQIASSFAKQLEEKYNIEDIEVNDLKNGMVQVFAVSDDFVKMGDNLLNNIKMENGGVVGQEIVFDDNGKRNTGVIKEIHEITGNYIVATYDGRTVLADKELDVISFGGMKSPAKSRMRFSLFKDGGNIEKENKEMIDSQTIEARHHVEELSKILTKKNKIEPWVVARMERATTDLSDVTHYLEGKKMAKGGGVGKLKVGKDDFSFLLKLSDNDLSKRLDLIRKQQVINGKQYLDAKKRGDNTSKIEESGKNLSNQENAIIQARIRVNKMAKGGGVGSKLKATYIPNRNIDELKTVFGQSIKGKDLIDGAYTTRKGIKQKPKMARTMFEEETYEFSKGGGVGRRVMPFLKFEYAIEARKKLNKGQLPTFDGGLGFNYLPKEKKLYYLGSITGDWKEVGEFSTKKESIDWLSSQLKMESFAKGGGVDAISLNEEMKDDVKYSSDYFGVGDFEEDEMAISQEEFEEVVDSSNTVKELIKNLDDTFSLDSKEAIYDILNLNKSKMSTGGGVDDYEVKNVEFALRKSIIESGFVPFLLNKIQKTGNTYRITVGLEITVANARKIVSKMKNFIKTSSFTFTESSFKKLKNGKIVFEITEKKKTTSNKDYYLEGNKMQTGGKMSGWKHKAKK